ncbi:polysaccharide deacetylase [Nostoc minutum NIES-26]|uniref:Polysaccharide deacetylase n=1 Tax=Nostoc minutum NIES-26 TaxID=1844469 RepID=A0A367RCY8_9NOSO|nr:polysaccharide deacetylase [Nostoc minutum NIES-26]
MFTNKLSQIFQVGIIILVTAGSGLSLSMLVPKGGFNQMLAIKKPAGKTMSATIETVAPATNQTLELPKAFQGTIVYQGKLKPNQKVIALTFDDGPSPKNTAQVLEILKKNHIKATFFMLGQMVKYYPQIAKQVAADGDVIGNHTWHHWYRQMDVATAASEIENTADIIYKTTGVKTTLFRPPGGFLHNGLADYAKNQKYAVIMWSELSGDAERRSPSVPAMVKNVLRSAKPGAIVLMHDGGGNRSRTVKALPVIIEGLKAQGYRFVTIPELLEMQAQEKMLTAASAVANHQ